MEILTTWKQGESNIEVRVNSATGMLEVYRDNEWSHSVDDTEENRASFYR